MWFEPIADLARGVAVGYRARSRFPLVGADHAAWLQAADRHGYRARFTAATLLCALQRREELPANSFLLVELDGVALHSDGVLGALRQAGDLSAVVLEVTSFENSRPNQVLQGLNLARANGAKIALRATGPGHVDPQQLADLAPEFVKVGDGLVAEIDQHPRHAAVLGAIGGLASQIDAWVIVEGVARQAELELLRGLRVPLVQGPLIGGARELMMGLESEARQLLRGSVDSDRPDQLSALAEPALTVPVSPELASEVTVVVDAEQRPLEVVVPSSGRRASSHPPLSVQRHDSVREVALRATSRPGEDQLAPVCLCDELGRVCGIIRIESLLQAVARAA